MEQIGRYKIIEELGKGAMGLVYKAMDPNIGRTVALKTMRLDVHGLEHNELLGRFRNEARAAGTLNHPNIVTIYDAGEHEGIFYIAMEFVEGRSLQEILVDNRVLPVEQVLSIAPLNAVESLEPQVRLVDQAVRLEGMPVRFVPELMPGDATKPLVENREHAVQRLGAPRA